MSQSYTLKSEENNGRHPAGTVCYEFHGHDYGCAREDTEATRIPHISMTLNEDGSGPFFTVATNQLDPKPEGRYEFI